MVMVNLRRTCALRFIPTPSDDAAQPESAPYRRGRDRTPGDPRPDTRGLGAGDSGGG